MQTTWLSGAEWFAVLRIGVGLWWLESWRHKDKKDWFTGGGIRWAGESPPSTDGPSYGSASTAWSHRGPA